MQDAWRAGFVPKEIFHRFESLRGEQFAYLRRVDVEVEAVLRAYKHALVVEQRAGQAL